MKRNKLMHILIAIMIVGGCGSVLTSIIPSGHKIQENMPQRNMMPGNTLPNQNNTTPNQNNTNENNTTQNKNNTNENNTTQNNNSTTNENNTTQNNNSTNNGDTSNTTTSIATTTSTVATVNSGNIGMRFVELLRELCITFFTGSTLMYLYLKFKDEHKENYQFVDSASQNYEKKQDE